MREGLILRWRLLDRVLHLLILSRQVCASVGDVKERISVPSTILLEEIMRNEALCMRLQS